MERHNNITGVIERATLASADASEDAGNYVCRICGKPSERKRRRNGSWFYYDRCRQCRRETAGGKSAPARISEGRLLYLLEILHEHLLKLKEGNWQGAPQKVVVKRLRSLLRVLEE